MDQPFDAGARPQRLLQGVQNQARRLKRGQVHFPIDAEVNLTPFSTQALSSLISMIPSFVGIRLTSLAVVSPVCTKVGQFYCRKWVSFQSRVTQASTSFMLARSADGDASVRCPATPCPERHRQRFDRSPVKGPAPPAPAARPEAGAGITPLQLADRRDSDAHSLREQRLGQLAPQPGRAQALAQRGQLTALDEAARS